MFPIILHPKGMSVLVVGDGPATARRRMLLDSAGIHYTHYSSWPGLSEPSMDHPDKPGDDGCRADIVFIADFDEPTSRDLHARAKAMGALVNVEDKRHLCDFDVPAIVRRGDLLLTVSTNAASPRLARRLRMMLEQLFPPVWAERVALIGRKRREWKAAGVSFEDVATQTDALMDQQDWLQADCPCLTASLRGVSPEPLAEADDAAAGAEPRQAQPIQGTERDGSGLPRYARNDETAP